MYFVDISNDVMDSNGGYIMLGELLPGSIHFVLLMVLCISKVIGLHRSCKDQN